MLKIHAPGKLLFTTRCWHWLLGVTATMLLTLTATSAHALRPLQASKLAVSSQAYHNCALMSDATVQCWGVNSAGQLGNGSRAIASTAVTVTGLTGATAVAVGRRHSCAVVSGGQVQCWGDNSVGELGDGTTTSQSSPVVVTGIGSATSVAAGDNPAPRRIDAIAHGALFSDRRAVAPRCKRNCS